MSTPQQTQGRLGIWMLTALVAGNMIGSGIWLLPASLGSIGSIGIIAWILTAIGSIFIALVFANMSSIMPRIGGPYAYCHAAFGDFVGFIMAYNYWVALFIGNAAVAVAFVGYLAIFFPTLAHNPGLAFVVGVASLWFVAIINIIGVRSAGVVQLVTTVLKILPLIVMGTVGLFFIHVPNLQDFNITGNSNLSALTAAATITLWSFIGLESATVPAEAAENPKRNIARATIYGTLIAATVYILSATAVMGILPHTALSASTAPYADAAKAIFGSTGGLLVALGAAISCFGALNGWTLLLGQIPMAAARDGLFPKVFSKETANGTPALGIIISTALATLLMALTLNQSLVSQFTMMILLATLASVIPYLFTTMAELLLFINYREQFNSKRLWLSSTIAIIACAYAFWAIVGSGAQIVYLGSLLLFSGVPVYVWVKWRAAEEERVIMNDELEKISVPSDTDFSH